MVCAFCGLWGRNLSDQTVSPLPVGVPTCSSCAHSLRPASTVVVAGVAIASALAHEGAPRAAVHALKFHGIDAVANRLAPLLEALLDPRTDALVPVPRVRTRLLAYRIDPARALALALGARTGLPVRHALRAPIMRSSQVRRRRAARFSLTHPVSAGAVLVDDVVTTGATLTAAAQVSGLRSAITLTSAYERVSASRV